MDPITINLWEMCLFYVLVRMLEIELRDLVHKCRCKYKRWKARKKKQELAARRACFRNIIITRPIEERPAMTDFIEYVEAVKK